MKTPMQWAREGYHRLLRYVRPDHPLSRLVRAEQALDQKRWGLAFDLSTQVLNDQAELPSAYLLRAIARLHLDDYPGARHDLHLFLARSDEPPAIAYFWRGWLYANQGEPSLAVSDFERVLEQHPDDPPLLYWLTRVHWMRGDWEQMGSYLDRLLPLQPFSAEVLELAAHRLQHQGDLVGAEQLFSRAIDLGGDETTLRFYRAQLRRHRGDLVTAETDIEHVLAQLPHLVPARLERVNLALDKGEFEEARHHAQHVLAMDEHNFEAHIGETLALLGLGDHRAMRKRLLWLRRHGPPHVLVEKLLGDLSMEEEMFDAAAASYRRAIELDGDDATLPLKLAGALSSAGHYDEAATLLDQLLAEDPHSFAALSGRADLHRLSDQPAAMRADLDRILELDPTQAWALCYRAHHRHWTGDIVGAWQDYDAALASEQGEAWIWAFRGVFHRQHGRFNTACRDFRHAITLDPEDPWIRRQWAALMRDEGKLQRAAEVLDRLLDDCPRDGYARLARLEIHLLAHHWQAARAHAERLIEQEHELTWLAHSIVAVLSEGAQRAQHRQAALSCEVTPTYWGYSTALVAAHRALLCQLRGEGEATLAEIHRAEQQLRPGERLWPGLRPLLMQLGADEALDHLSRFDSLTTARIEAVR